jgi:hypothetical protein
MAERIGSLKERETYIYVIAHSEVYIGIPKQTQLKVLPLYFLP